MRVRLYGYTEKGVRHEVNEDVILVGRTLCESGYVFLNVADDGAGHDGVGTVAAVADGMGSHAVGAAAARLMLETFGEIFHREAQGCDIRGLCNALIMAAKEGNRVVIDYGTRQEDYAGMGCTLAGVIMMGGEYVVFNAGDSRVYRYCRGVLRQLTDDDTLVASAVRMGRMTVGDAMTSTTRHYVTNASGSRSFRLRVDERRRLEPGDSLLVCSDGVHGALGLAAMEAVLAAWPNAEERCRGLVWAAAERGLSDDISVIVINVEASDGAPG